jgi:hypothetical protein
LGRLGQDQEVVRAGPICPFINMDISVWLYRLAIDRYSQTGISIFINGHMGFGYIGLEAR